MLKVAFVDNAGLPYTLDTPYSQPLGGIQSAVGYLAESLVQQGVECLLINGVTQTLSARGVTAYSIQNFPMHELQSCDVVVAVGSANLGGALRGAIAEKTPLLLWTGHAHDQDAVQALSDPVVRGQFTGFVFVSEWQKNHYQTRFQLDRSCFVLRNAISMPFMALLDEAPAKINPVIAYTSTPFRGLELLLQAFPDIRRAIPEAECRIYSSMKVYGVAAEQDQFQALYQKAMQMPGVNYIGSIAQAELAKQMKEVAVLAYPNTFEETSCIAVMEAMAAGCQVVTSALGALPETMNGYGQLIPVAGGWKGYQKRFVRSVIGALQQKETFDAAEQKKFVEGAYVWPRIAEQWRQVFLTL